MIDIPKAIAQYTPGAAWCCPELKGKDGPWITIGGGNAAGLFNQTTLTKIITDMPLVKRAKYSAIVFDVEEVDGPSSVNIPLFKRAFATAKGLGLKVVVTTSHSAPYATDTPQDAVNYLKEWVQDPNIDILSPQLYSSGMETSPEFAETSTCAAAGCKWDLYKQFKGTFAPSIVSYGQYPAVQNFFQHSYGIIPGGFIEWKQEPKSMIILL